MVRSAKHSLDRPLELNASGVHDLTGSFTAHSAEEMPGDVGRPARDPNHELFIPSLPAAELQSGG